MTEAFQVSISKSPDGLYHVYGRGLGPHGKEIAEMLLQSLAGGKLAVIREEPWQETDKDFPTQTEITHSGVRFSFMDKPGEWQKVDALKIPLLGDA